MPLQIRRGSSVQRLAITPLDGELIWDQTEKRLYVGDGVEAGGTIATGYNNADAVLAIGNALDNGIHDGITFTYNETSISAVLSNVDASVLSGSANISIVSDDGSTVLIDTFGETIYAPGGFFGDLIGDVFGNCNGNLIGNVTGDVVGDSVSTISLNFSPTPDSVNNLNNIEILNIESGLSVFNIGNGTYSGSYSLILNSAKESGGLIPSNFSAGEYTNTIGFSGFLDGEYKVLSSIATKTSSNAVLSDTRPEATLEIHINAGDGNAPASFDNAGLFLRGSGVMEGLIYKASSYPTGNFPFNGIEEEGMIIFDSTSKQFKGWNGTSWVVLG